MIKAGRCIGRLALVGLAVCVVLGAAGAQVPLQHISPHPPALHPAARPPRAPARLADLPVAKAPSESASLPGPLRSLLRIAGISQKAAPADVLPLLSRAVYQNGYQGQAPTEFLTLVKRYLQQARELRSLAQPSGTIHVKRCEDAGQLLQVLGYKLDTGCTGAGGRLHTSMPERAFLTIDSGFPLTDLEEALQQGKPFQYDYPDSAVPVLYKKTSWLKLGEGRPARSGDLVDALMDDPATARLYWAMSKMDEQTGRDLEQGLGLRELIPYRALLDFYGGQIAIHAGHVLVPGGVDAEAAWQALVGASPATPLPFLSRLLARDGGSIAAYYDALSRLETGQQEHLTQSPRLAEYYAAFRVGEGHNHAGAGSYSKASDLLVLGTRLRWSSEGSPVLPGSLQAWNAILGRAVKEKALSRPDQVVETLLERTADGGPNEMLQLYLTLCEIDRKKPEGIRLSPTAVTLVANHYASFGDWTLIFSEFPDLDDHSIQAFFRVADGLAAQGGTAFRANALGSFQANVGLWQILARQKQIPASVQNVSWQAVIEPFAHVTTPNQLFESSMGSLRALSLAAGGEPGGSADLIVELLAGPVQTSDEGQRVHAKLAANISAVLRDQQLVSLDTLLALDEALRKLEQGRGDTSELALQIAELREFELPPAIFSRGEQLTWAPGVYTTRHSELHVRGELAELARAPAGKAQIHAARGKLASFLRDTLVGLNYAYYEPPGAQILHINPLFVRAHDFLGASVTQDGTVWRSPRLVGAGVSAGGGAYLMGSMVDLPYALASAEQNFIVPENIEALIWRQIVPDLLVSSTLPRWWNLSSAELHAVALHQRSGEELLVVGAKDAIVRARVITILSHQLAPRYLQEVRTALESEAATKAYLPLLMASTTLYLSQRYRAEFLESALTAGPASREIGELVAGTPDQVDMAQISLHFGVPHPVLTRCNGLELLNVETFPAYSGRASRLLGESLESNNLYWARLADELGYSPAMMHLLVPELTRVMIGKIFASELEDWPAVQRAMRETGEDLKSGRIASLPRAAGLTATATYAAEGAR